MIWGDIFAFHILTHTCSKPSLATCPKSYVRWFTGTDDQYILVRGYFLWGLAGPSTSPIRPTWKSLVELFPGLRISRTSRSRLGLELSRIEQGHLCRQQQSHWIGVRPREVAAEHTVMLGAFARHGLDYHEVVEATTMTESLGVRIDGRSGGITSTCTRDWRLPDWRL